MSLFYRRPTGWRVFSSHQNSKGKKVFFSTYKWISKGWYACRVWSNTFCDLMGWLAAGPGFQEIVDYELGSRLKVTRIKWGSWSLLLFIVGWGTLFIFSPNSRNWRLMKLIISTSRVLMIPPPHISLPSLSPCLSVVVNLRRISPLACLAHILSPPPDERWWERRERAKFPRACSWWSQYAPLVYRPTPSL